MKISARNCIEGKIIDIKEGPVSCEVTIETPLVKRSSPPSRRLPRSPSDSPSAAKLTPSSRLRM